MSNQRYANSRNNNQSNNGNDQNEGYFSLKLTGLGYISNLMEREPKETGDLYTTGTVAVLVGPKQTKKRQYRYIDVIVTGQKTLDLIWQYEQDFIDERKVLIKFCMSDISAKAYSKKDGTPSASLKSYLYAIEKIWIDNELVHDATVEEKQETPRATGARSNQQQRGSSSRSPERFDGNHQGNGHDDDQGGYQAPRNARKGQSQNRSSQQPRQAPRQQSNSRYQGY